MPCAMRPGCHKPWWRGALSCPSPVLVRQSNKGTTLATRGDEAQIDERGFNARDPCFVDRGGGSCRSNSRDGLLNNRRSAEEPDLLGRALTQHRAVVIAIVKVVNSHSLLLLLAEAGAEARIDELAAIEQVKTPLADIVDTVVDRHNPHAHVLVGLTSAIHDALRHLKRHDCQSHRVLVEHHVLLV